MIASLSGVRALRPATGPLNLILLGQEVGTVANATEVAFAGAAGEVPDDLEYAELDVTDASRVWSVRTARGEFVVRARSLHLHRDVSVAVRALLPRQSAPLARRLAWRWLPALASSAVGRRLLIAARRR
jgi:hypothetical protein